MQASNARSRQQLNEGWRIGTTASCRRCSAPEQRRRFCSGRGVLASNNSLVQLAKVHQNGHGRSHKGAVRPCVARQRRQCGGQRFQVPLHVLEVRSCLQEGLPRACAIAPMMNVGGSACYAYC